MRLTNYICFANKECAPLSYVTKFYYAHADRDNLMEFRKENKKGACPQGLINFVGSREDAQKLHPF